MRAKYFNYRRRRRRVDGGFWARFRDPLGLFTAVLALATVALAFVSWLQWCTLDKTDETFRAGERAFVFVTHNAVGWQRAKMVNGEMVRDYPIVWENSGNSPTRDLVVKLYCLPLGPLTIENPISSIDKGRSIPLVLGPKQNSWGGYCEYSNRLLNLVKDNAYHLYISASANYFDIFDQPHRTEMCVELTDISGAIDNIDVNPVNQINNCGRNCADKECDKP